MTGQLVDLPLCMALCLHNNVGPYVLLALAALRLDPLMQLPFFKSSCHLPRVTSIF